MALDDPLTTENIEQARLFLLNLADKVNQNDKDGKHRDKAEGLAKVYKVLLCLEGANAQYRKELEWLDLDKRNLLGKVGSLEIRNGHLEKQVNELLNDKI